MWPSCFCREIGGLSATVGGVGPICLPAGLTVITGFGGRAFRNVRDAAARWRPALGQKLPQKGTSGSAGRGGSSSTAGSSDTDCRLDRVNRSDRVAGRIGRLAAFLDGRLRAQIAGALCGVGDKARPLVGPDRLHGPGDFLGSVAEVVLACCRGDPESGPTQVPDDGIVGPAPEEPGCKGCLIERGGTQPGRRGLLQAEQGAVVVLCLDLPSLRCRKRCDRAISQCEDAISRAFANHG